MYLGEVIEFLETQDGNTIVPLGFGNPHSYRGCYSDLAFEPIGGVTVSDMLSSAREALGSTYHGYKGGEFTMDEFSEVYISEHGYSSGDNLSLILLRYMTGDIYRET